MPIEAFSQLRTANQVLFSGLIDYAGLFPPASLSMADAATEYRRARRGPHSWLLGRFICPATRLEELGGLLMSTMSAGEKPWPISVILDGDVARAAVAAHSFDAEMDPAAQVALLEVALPSEASDGRPPDEAAVTIAPVVTAAMTASQVALPFFEVAVGESWQAGIPNAVAALAQRRQMIHRPLGGKLRCGGGAPEAFPSSEQVAAFIMSCTALDLPFKATAGLHHPVRHYDAEVDVMRHGFLNLLVAAALARSGFTIQEVTTVVDETDPAAFSLAAAGLSWRGHRVRVGDLGRTREQFAAYGSCSFDEPVADLVALGMVAAP